MLPWSWVTWAARSCSLNFKCSQPDYSFPYCDGGGEGFEGQSLLQYTFRRELKIRVLACFWRFCRKMCCPTKSSLLPLTLIHISLAPLCLAAAAAALRALQQVFLLSGTPPGPLEKQCSVLSNAASLPTLSVGITPGAALAEARGLGLEKLFYMMFSIVIYYGLNVMSY